MAQLTLGATSPPSPETLDDCLARLRAEGYESVVTGALNPADALVFVDAGFRVRERLHLLAHDMHDLPPARLRTYRARRGERPAVLALDNLAFEPSWRLDADALADAIDATPSSRFRVLRAPDGALDGYAISGRADEQGYLQRIAVHPDRTGRGHGRALVADALAWLARHGVTRTLVNTQLDNDAALALYARCGFTRLPVGLCVFGMAL